jgi:tetratricopeptide (TPR) repeat protein
MLENAESLNTQAIELAYHGDYTEAIACFKRAISMENTNYLLWFNLGVTYRDAGELGKAKSALKCALSFNPEDQEIMETLALICNTMGSPQEAINYCSQALQLNDENPHLWNTAGVIFFNNGEYREAGEAFEHAVTFNPYYYDALYNLRDTYVELGNSAGRDVCNERMASLSQGIQHA